MAYWLGFLFADGNVNDKNANYVVQLHLKCIDYLHVEKYKKSLQSTYHLGLYKNGNSCSVSHKISNHLLALDLIALGCTPRKSLTLKWPNSMPDEFVSHFVRGYFDGDGCIHYRKRAKEFVVIFVGSRDFIDSLQIYIAKNVLLNSKARGSVQHQDTSSRLCFAGNISSLLVLNWMYRHSNEATRLDRKYALYRKFQQTAHLKPKMRSGEINGFLESHRYKKLMVCQYGYCCPQFHATINVRKNYKSIQQIRKNDGSLIKVWQ
eukprot:66215_1